MTFLGKRLNLPIQIIKILYTTTIFVQLGGMYIVLNSELTNVIRDKRLVIIANEKGKICWKARKKTKCLCTFCLKRQSYEKLVKLGRGTLV
jgi:hypothetical protein